MYCRLAYLIPAAIIIGYIFALVLGVIFRNAVPAPSYQEDEITFVVALLGTVASVVCLCLARPRWWHAILFPLAVALFWSLLFPFLVQVKTIV